MNYSSTWISTHGPTDSEYWSHLLPGFYTDNAGGWRGNRTGRPHRLGTPWHPPLDLAKCPRSGLFKNKNITLWKHIMNTVKYGHKSTRYKAQWHKTINMHIIKIYDLQYCNGPCWWERLKAIPSLRKLKFAAWLNHRINSSYKDRTILMLWL